MQAMEQSSALGRVHMSREFCQVLQDSGKGALVVDFQSDGTAFLEIPASAAGAAADTSVGSPDSSANRTPNVSVRVTRRASEQ